MRDIKALIALADSPKARSKTKFHTDPETERDLDEFVLWLQREENKTRATSQSYRSYVAKALVEDPEWEDMTSDMRSGVRAFARFDAWKEAQLEG
jgi:hypothetical protein